MKQPYEPREDTHLLIECVLKLPESELVAEVGCGPGYVLEVLAEKNLEAIGIDIDPISITLAKERLSKNYSKIHLINASILPLRKESVNLVVSNPPYLPSEEDFYDPAIHAGPRGVEVGLEVLEKAKTVMKQGGRVVLTASSLGDVDFLLQRSEKIGFSVVRKLELKGFFETIYCFIFSLERF